MATFRHLIQSLGMEIFLKASQEILIDSKV